MKKESSGATLMKKNSSTAGSGAMFMKRREEILPKVLYSQLLLKDSLSFQFL